MQTQNTQRVIWHLFYLKKERKLTSHLKVTETTENAIFYLQTRGFSVRGIDRIPCSPYSRF